MGFSPPFEINGIPCEFFVPGEGSQSLVESFVPGGPTATLLIKCAWADRQEVIQGLLGLNGSTGGTIDRIPPLEYFDSLVAEDFRTIGIAGPYWVCTSIPNVSGIGWITNQENGFGAYQDAVLQCQFTVPSYNPGEFDPANLDVLNIAFVTPTVRTSTEVFVPPTKATFFYSGDTARPLLNSHVGLLQVHLELELMRHYMPFTVINAIMTISGSVNMNPVQVGDRSFGPEHVLFLMGEISPTADPATGGRLWDIPLRLLCSANHTWNEFLNEKGVYEIVKTSGAGGVSPYPVSDISILFGIDFT